MLYIHGIMCKCTSFGWSHVQIPSKSLVPNPSGTRPWCQHLKPTFHWILRLHVHRQCVCFNVIRVLNVHTQYPPCIYTIETRNDSNKQNHYDKHSPHGYWITRTTTLATSNLARTRDGWICGYFLWNVWKNAHGYRSIYINGVSWCLLFWFGLVYLNGIREDCCMFDKWNLTKSCRAY